jgi:hypothetical protein
MSTATHVVEAGVVYGCPGLTSGGLRSSRCRVRAVKIDGSDGTDGTDGTDRGGARWLGLLLDHVLAFAT